MSLYVNCAWRLRTADRILYGWTDAADDPAQLTSTLEQLVGKRVESVGIRRPAWDLTIGFEGGKILDIFSDQDESCRRGRPLFTESEILTVGPRSRLSRNRAPTRTPTKQTLVNGFTDYASARPYSGPMTGIKGQFLAQGSLWVTATVAEGASLGLWGLPTGRRHGRLRVPSLPKPHPRRARRRRLWPARRAATPA